MEKKKERESGGGVRVGGRGRLGFAGDLLEGIKREEHGVMVLHDVIHGRRSRLVHVSLNKTTKKTGAVDWVSGRKGSKPGFG
jgi:hypothetical protein